MRAGFFVLVITILCCASAVSQEVASSAVGPTPGRTLLHMLRTRGALNTAELAAIESAAELNPKILEAAAARASALNDPLRASPQQLQAAAADLLNRAKLQAIRSEVVPIQPALRAQLMPSLEKIESPTLQIVELPKPLDVAAAAALKDRLLVVRPLCPPGVKPTVVAGKATCIEGDPWTEELFRSVVAILVDGKRSCTGSALGDGMVLTAAHCVIEPVDGTAVVKAPSRLQVVSLHGKTLSLTAPVAVPQQMMALCLPQCPDMQYDFAILRVDPAFADWTPIPLLTKLSSAGDIPVTLAGYGVTTMPQGVSKSGLYIGAQRLNASVDRPFQWKYDMAIDEASSSCYEDSGGPIYLGRPRQPGDQLALIGLISRFFTVDQNCMKTEAAAVNFTQEGPRSALCKLIGGKPGFCTP